MDIPILYEDGHIIVALKPPKIPSQADKSGDKDMLSYLKEYLKEQYPMAQNPYIGLVHRLDRPVGGLMVFAKSKWANAKLSEQIQNKQFNKEYLAVVTGKPEKVQGELVDYLLKNQKLNLSKVVSKETKGAKEAILEYECLDSVEFENEGWLSLLKIVLKTGRHHQIRVQLSHAGIPVWGDNKYNPAFVKRREWTQIALWAYSLSFYHPKTNQLCLYIEKPEQYPFNQFNM
ncbi:MAG TPA: RluA family pseudouridine synthase [Defluviitaleaceae bacterium]|jgi:23S rRNA pseudouridine1911/1915/1917 synthase|nr:RluA family pseudouridine synthase [Candidatus Epulonipiscium sp.]HOQ16085.1 RluA family pseudouridine synthase [Defluviitaleaceae bacterium]HPT75823.1 RluA family pseudouridine synthase [Defluviitaleaceae bacterium]HQD50762.1 RluA family pseudouridine synthase [Defluviitaleaceae bacterium]